MTLKNVFMIVSVSYLDAAFNDKCAEKSDT
jgi:hypothetical protein